MSETRRDVALLDSLAQALEPPALDPSAEGLFRLRTAVAEHYGLVDGASRPASTTAWWRRPWAVASLATGMALAGTGTAMATGAAPVPRPVRAVAHAVGLPIDSPDVADVRHANEVLKKDLSTPPGGAPAASTAADAQTLQRKLAELSPSDRSRVGTDPHRTLDRAGFPPATSGGDQPRSPSGTPSAGDGRTGDTHNQPNPSQPPRSPTGNGNSSHRGQSPDDRSQTSTPLTTSPTQSTTPTSQPSVDDGHHRGSGDDSDH